jgi:aminoglycoside-2''-adenylyltransferase
VADAARQNDVVAEMARFPEAEDEDAEFFRRYGPWEPLTVAEARELFDPIGIPWWVAGGHAAEAFHRVPRVHEDIDISMFRKHVPELRRALEGIYHIWSAGSGALRPVDDRFPEPADDADQVWLRAHALAPWRADVVLNPDADGDWVSRRDRFFRAPLEEVTWERDGVRYLNPEIVLSFKARQRRPKDEHDFAAILPLLDDDARGRLADYIERCEPAGHPWLDRLSP